MIKFFLDTYSENLNIHKTVINKTINYLKIFEITLIISIIVAFSKRYSKIFKITKILFTFSMPRGRLNNFGLVFGFY